MKCIYLLILCILYILPWSINGASYTGTSATDAGHYLDNSQGKKGFGFNNPGHPRDHSSAANPPNVEKYSATQPKSGFDSRNIQNEVAHLVLSHPNVQKALGILNQYDKKNKNKNTAQYKRQDVKLSKTDLNIQNSHLTGGRWVKGKKTKSFPIGGAVIVLQHFRGKETDPHAAVHIQTFYPN